jgi:hypothetical protein
MWANLSKVAFGNIRRMEGFDGPVGSRTGSFAKIMAVFEKTGIEFLSDDRPGVRPKSTLVGVSLDNLYRRNIDGP